MLPPPRVHWLHPCRVGPTRPVIGCRIDHLHIGRGNWARLGPALGVRVASAATEVDSRAGDGPVPGSQVKQDGYKVGGWGSIFEAAFPWGIWGLGGTREEWLCCPSWRGRRRGWGRRPLYLSASRGSSSRLRTATAHRTLRCSGPTVRVTAADLSLGSANPWPFSDPGLAGRQAALRGGGRAPGFREAG